MADSISAQGAPSDGLHPEAGFSADWLALRAGADARARDAGLTVRAQQWLEVRRQQRDDGLLRLLDLGAGCGANPRFLAGRLPGPQAWTLFDHDPALLARAAAQGAAWRDMEGTPVRVETVCDDLARWQAEELSGFDLVTASALIDLVGADWIERLARGCGRAACAVLITLSVDGGWGLTGVEEDADDVFVRAAFNAHQRRAKGVGAALGPDAARRLADALTTHGYQVWLAPSPWRLRMSVAADQGLAMALLAGWRDAAQAQCPTAAARVAAWYRRRRESLLGPDTVVEVGHVDLLALPGGGFDPSRGQ